MNRRASRRGPLAQPPCRSAYACARGLHSSLTFAPIPPAPPAAYVCTPVSRGGLLTASGLLRSPRCQPCSPSALLAACKPVQRVRWRGRGVALGSAGWALAAGRRGGPAPGGRTRPVEKAVCISYTPSANRYRNFKGYFVTVPSGLHPLGCRGHCASCHPVRKARVELGACRPVQDHIRRSDLQVYVAEQRIGQLERIRLHLLGKGVIGTDAENLDIQVLER
jgi:hypothetical protein